MKNMNKANSTTAGDTQMDNLFQEEMTGEQDSCGRIERILYSARKETGMRDLFTHVLLRIWTPLLSMGSIIFTFYQKKSTQNKSTRGK